MNTLSVEVLEARRRAVRRAMNALEQRLLEPSDDWTWLHDLAVDWHQDLLDRSVELSGQIIDHETAFAREFVAWLYDPAQDPVVGPELVVLDGGRA
jgi:hypothetical protein